MSGNWTCIILRALFYCCERQIDISQVQYLNKKKKKFNTSIQIKASLIHFNQRLGKHHEPRKTVNKKIQY